MKFNFKKLISYYKPYKKALFLNLLFAITAEAIVVAIPIILRYITNDVIFFDRIVAYKNIFMLAAVILIMLAIRHGCIYYVLYYGHLMGTKIENDMKNEIFQHFQKLSHKFYDNRKIGELMSRITTDLYEISEFFHHVPEEILSIVTRFIGVFTVFFIINWKLSLITIWIVPVIYVYTFIHIKKPVNLGKKILIEYQVLIHKLKIASQECVLLNLLQMKIWKQKNLKQK